jgi:hypothetical protein
MSTFNQLSLLIPQPTISIHPHPQYLVVKVIHLARLALRLAIALQSITCGSGSGSGSSEFGTYLDSTDPGAECPICQDAFADPVALPCGHAFCEDCAREWLGRERTCPLCRAEVPFAGPRLFEDGCTSLLPQVF